MCVCLLESLTVCIVGVLHPCHGAAAEDHFVLRQRACLIREDVLHLAKVLRDIKSSALQVRVCLLVVKLHVLMDEVHLTDLDYFNRHEQRDGYQHLEGTKHTVQRRLCLLSLYYYTNLDSKKMFVSFQLPAMFGVW